VRKLYTGFTINAVDKVNYTLNHYPGTKPRFRPEVFAANH
jgi:hypothetical protein